MKNGSPQVHNVLLVDDNNNDAYGETLESITNASHIHHSLNGTDPDFKFQIKWGNVLGMVIFHVIGLYGLYLIMTTGHVLFTVACIYLMIMFSGLGVTAGTHRLFSHRAYKAKLPLRILLMIMQTSAVQNDVIDWCRDHRVHHKYSETDSDPHNANRGFFFAHIGWLMLKKHPMVIKRGREADLSDLRADPVLQFQHKYYLFGVLLLAVVLPVSIAYFLLGESLQVSIISYVVTRLMFLLHGTSLVNSAAHLYGNRPYDKNINPSENLFVSSVAFGEGFHNYHHVFPWDYSTSEFGMAPNLTTLFINLMARIGWAYDLKKASPEMVKARAERTG